MTEEELFEKLILNGKDANKRYLPPLSENSKNKTLENIDKLYINLLEEIYEAREALMKTSSFELKPKCLTKDEKIKNKENEEAFFIECCDILNYATTITYILFDWIERKFNFKPTFDNYIYDKIFIMPLNMRQYFIELGNGFAFNFINSRRSFPERRWHHNDPMLEGEDLYDAISVLLKVVVQFTYDIQQFLARVYGLENEDIWNICNHKHITRLP